MGPSFASSTAALSLLALLATSACSKPAPEGPAPAPSASVVKAASPVASGHPQPPPPPAPNGADAGAVTDPMQTMFGEMENERKNRPKVHPNVDDGYAALTAAGVVVKAKQSLARTYHASFCSHGIMNGGGMSVLLCEFPDAEHTAAGVAEAKKAFPGVVTRHVYSHKTLMMVTMFLVEKTPQATTDAQKKAVAALNAL
jgi:hypothetical protein